VLSLGIYYFKAQKTHTILVVAMVLWQAEIVGQVLAVCGGAEVGRNVGASVAGAVNWERGVQEGV